jgi:hypothetical protein
VAVMNGNDIDITATIANGGTGKADWVVTYPIPGTITDANGDLLLPNGSASTGAADNDLSAGGNRTVMDFNATKARLGGTAGGGAAVSVALLNGTSEILITDAGATDKTINGGNRFAGQCNRYGYLKADDTPTDIDPNQDWTIEFVKSMRFADAVRTGNPFHGEFGLLNTDTYQWSIYGMAPGLAQKTNITLRHPAGYEVVTALGAPNSLSDYSEAWNPNSQVGLHHFMVHHDVSSVKAAFFVNGIQLHKGTSKNPHLRSPVL